MQRQRQRVLFDTGLKIKHNVTDIYFSFFQFDVTMGG